MIRAASWPANTKHQLSRQKLLQSPAGEVKIAISAHLPIVLPSTWPLADVSKSSLSAIHLASKGLYAHISARAIQEDVWHVSFNNGHAVHSSGTA